MKTAMQILIDEMEEVLFNVVGDENYQLGYKDSLRDCIIKAKRLCINEKYQIMNDFERGWLDLFHDKGTEKEQYYNQTYNQNK